MSRELIKEAVRYIGGKLKVQPEIGLILGSGLGVLADEIEEAVTIPYEDIPHFPKSTVEGHKGQLVIGQLSGKPVLALQGRFHYYEGYSMEEVVFPVRVMQELGIRSVLLTNAAGGVNESFTPGDLMIITDHINNIGTNPLIGPNDADIGPRFPDLSAAYDRDYIKYARSCAKKLGISVQEGVYAANSGPVYETPAEVRMLRTFGADAVGMSTVPETIAARHGGMRVLGLSCITNMAAGMLDQPLSHDEVMDTAKTVQSTFIALVKEIIGTLPGGGAPDAHV